MTKSTIQYSMLVWLSPLLLCTVYLKLYNGRGLNGVVERKEGRKKEKMHSAMETLVSLLQMDVLWLSKDRIVEVQLKHKQTYNRCHCSDACIWVASRRALANQYRKLVIGESIQSGTSGYYHPKGWDWVECHKSDSHGVGPPWVRTVSGIGHGSTHLISLKSSWSI